MGLAVTLTMLAAATASPGGSLAVRTCPGGVVRTYPLDSARDANALTVAGIVIANNGRAPVTLDKVRIDLLKDGAAVDTRAVGTAELTSAASATQGLLASGMVSTAAFQFCDGRLLGNAKAAQNNTLAPGEALYLGDQTFAWRGRRDALRISAGETSLTVPIDAKPATPIRWPLGKGVWSVLNGPSLHTAHRWALPEQFALDIVKVDAGARTHRGAGARMSDFYAYGAPVLAVADATVAKVYHARRDEPPLLKRRGETGEAYLGRVGAAQGTKLAGGAAAVLGEAVILKLADATFAVYAHLAPGSVVLHPGDPVRAGAQLGRLGNTGNTTEPHLHFQLCDGPSGLSCAGIPAAFSNIAIPLADEPRPLQSGDIVIVE